MAYYSELHLERLKLIEQFKARGLSIRGMKELLQRIEKGEVNLNQWLGLEAELKNSWIPDQWDQPTQLSHAEVQAFLGDTTHQALQPLIKAGILVPQAEGYLIPSQRLLEIGRELSQKGLPIELGLQAVEIIAKNTRKMAEQLVKFHIAQLGKNFASNANPEEVIQGLESLRPIGAEVVGILFGHSMSETLQHLVDSGKLTRLQSHLVRMKPPKSATKSAK